MKLDLIAFKNDLDHFVTCGIYLISTNVKTKQILTSMLVSPSKTEKQTKIKTQTRNSQSLNTVPSKETHGAVSLLRNISKIIVELGFQISNIPQVVDTVFQVTVLLSPSSQSKGLQ